MIGSFWASWLWVPGAALVLLVLIDAFKTTLRPGEGSLANLTGQTVCMGCNELSRVFGSRSPMLWSGVAVVLTLFVTWVSLLWLGWTLIFLSGPEAVMQPEPKQPANLVQRIYFAGFTISTLGVGDVNSGPGFWKPLTAFASLNGLFLITFVITFIVPIADAAALKRQTALRIRHAGPTPVDLLLRDPCVKEGKPLVDLMGSLMGNLVEVEERHRAFPILHRFHSPDAKQLLRLGIAALDEALTITDLAMERRSYAFEQARATIDGFLATTAAAWMKPAGEPLPPPSLEPLRQAGVALVDDATFRDRLDEEGVRYRRRVLRALVESGGFGAEELHRAEEEHDADEEEEGRREKKLESAG